MAADSPLSIPPIFLARWRSGRYVGEARPTCRVELRRGRFNRRYAPWPGKAFGQVGSRPLGADQWQAFWEPSEPYSDLPNVEQFDIEQSLDNNGIATATITMTNQSFVELAGPLGAYHVIQKGIYAPLYGYGHPGRPAPTEQQNAWFQRLNSKAQVTIHEGYGDSQIKSFTGLIDDLDVTSIPGAVQIVVRDFGQVLADSTFFGWNMDPTLRDPITFVPAPGARESKVGGSARASSYDSAHPPRFVLDAEGDTYWRSDGVGEPSVTEWVQIALPAGKYHRFYLHPQYDNMEMYVSLYVRHRGAKIPRHSLWDGAPIGDDDLAIDNVHGGIPEGFLKAGLGEVPGENGGHPYIKVYPSINDKGRYFNLPGTFDLGAGSVLRISFRNLGESTSSGTPKKRVYRAGAKRLIAMKIETPPPATKKRVDRRHVYVSDVSDIVRVCCRWAGFKDWNIEDTGVNIDKPYTVNKADKFVDIIAKVKEATGYVFFMGPPTSVASSIGTPTFRQAQVFQAPRDQSEQVRGDDILTGVTQRWTDEPLRYIIRVRGSQPKSKTAGDTLGGDKVRRFMFTYRPPWSNRMGGVLRHLTYPNAALDSKIECEIAAYLIALQIALANATAMFSMPGTPHVGPDELVAVRDSNTGSNMRVYIASVRRTLRLGEQPAYDSEYGGAIPDTPDMLQIALAYLNAIARRTAP